MWDFIARIQVRGNVARIRVRPRVHLRTLNVRMACLQKWRKTRGSDVAVNSHAGCAQSTRGVPIGAGDLHVNAFEDAIVFHAGINFLDHARDTAHNLIRDVAL